MKQLKLVICAIVALFLSACGSLSVLKPSLHSGKLEKVGILFSHVPCAECDAVLGLLDANMQTQEVVLTGKVHANQAGYLIAVLGTSGTQASEGLRLNVEQSKAITSFDYLPFLTQAVNKYTQQKFQCASLWDKTYAWRIDGRQPILTVDLSNPFSNDSGTIHLEYDGLNQQLLSADTPEHLNPCQLGH